MKIKLKNILMISFLAVAGIFGVTSAVINNQVKEEHIAEKADAITTGGWTGSTDSLYFVPDYTWKTWSYDGVSRQPRLYIQWNNGANQNANWPGVIASYTNNDVYRFDNIPLTSLNQLTIVFHQNKDFIRYDFSTSSRNEWYSGSTHSKNVFGSPNDGWYNGGDTSGSGGITMVSGYYKTVPTETMISGSIVSIGLNWPNWPAANNCLTGTSSSSSITLDVVYQDEFQLVFYDELKNASPSGSASKWFLYGQTSDSDTNGGRAWKGYDNLTINVYDDSISTSTAVSSTNKSKYIEKDGNNIKILHAGTITVTTTSKRGTTITIRWAANTSRSFTGSTDKPDCVVGSFNAWDSSINQISWNSETARFETVVAVAQNDEFKFFNSNGSGDARYLNIDTLHTAIATGATTEDGSGGASNWKITSSTGYYAIGWYYYNSNPSGAPSSAVGCFVDYNHYFFNNDKTSTSSTRTVEALCNRIPIYTTCDCTKNNADIVKSLYDSCNYSSKTTYMANKSITDYDYNSYISNNKDYSKTAKTYSTNAYIKYQWLQYIGGNTAVKPSAGLGMIGLFGGSEDNFSTIIIIISSSVALLSVTALSILVIRKRKNKEE